MTAEEKILSTVSKHISLDSAEEDHFLSLLEYRSVKKKDYLLDHGQICRFENFVLSGCFRTLYTDFDGKEHTTIFSTENWWVADRVSFFSDQPSQLQIQAIEPSEVFQISKTNLTLLYSTTPKFERFFRILFQQAYLSQQERIINKMALTAEERYRLFLKKYPALLNRISLKYIASYLGITPEFLSMVRKNHNGSDFLK